MTNKTKYIIESFVKQLGLQSFGYVGEYPYDIEGIGNKYPSVLVQEGDESIAEIIPNKSVKKELLVHCWLYTQINQSRTNTITDLQNTIEDTILDDATLTDINISVKVDCIDWVMVEKGDYTKVLDKHNVGYTDNLSIRRITFSVIFRSER